MLSEVDVLDAQTQALVQAESGAVHQCGQQARLAVEVRQNGAHLVAGEHDGHVGWHAGAHHALQLAYLAAEHLTV